MTAGYIDWPLWMRMGHALFLATEWMLWHPAKLALFNWRHRQAFIVPQCLLAPMELALQATPIATKGVTGPSEIPQASFH